MPPIPAIRAAQALPVACLEVGKMSTSSARSTAETKRHLKVSHMVRSIDSVGRTCIDREIDAVY
jgi:hypothetical protein